ncbi:tryptophan-rich sensory protein [Paracoccus spongiarum]|uniref:Tryptophan-rich sensory protein n=1 Tax=Paracoccus spongiarum TaxID=3064387 RepID=A0ABT9JDH2_9RHOB|nr:tryptophan-rich sensory protein [Paracoccus sp. 2205BS29-5]MDP5307760.1 tryptophan-rich sensory protein [Paracoccus sp. 2205BS29-5]
MSRPLAILVLLATLAFALSTVVSQNFAGYPPDLFPVPQTDPPVQPAGWAFSIWGVIYLWLLASAGFGLLRRAQDADWTPARLPLLGSLAIGAFWLEVAGRAPVWATAMILAMLLLAVLAFLRAPRRDRAWLELPLGLYAGWLTAASGVSAGIVAAGFGILTAQVAAIAALMAILAVALAVQRLRPAGVTYPLGVLWALAGVIGASLSPANGTLLALAALGCLLLAARVILSMTRS